MYSIVYTLIDNSKLNYFNEMMISIKSLKYRMPEKKILIVTDDSTKHYIEMNIMYYEDVIKQAEFIVVNIPAQYTQKEKSRFLKTSLRKYVEGDFLFIDTDTIICEKFPENVSQADIAMVLDGNVTLSEHLDRKGAYSINKWCGIKLGKIENYYNSGVIWVKDTEAAKKLFELWHEQWKESVKTGFAFDQPSLNKIIIDHRFDVEMLDGTWNCQVSGNPFPLKYLANAKIIHYYNAPDSSYLMCNPKIKNKGYNSSKVNDIIVNPKVMFGKTAIFSLDGYVDLFDSKAFKLIIYIYKEHSKLFYFNEKILKCLILILKRFRRKKI